MSVQGTLMLVNLCPHHILNQCCSSGIVLEKTKGCRAGLKGKDILRPISKESLCRLCHDDPAPFTGAQRTQRLCPEGNCFERFPFMEVPPFQQSLSSSPSRPHC